MTNLDAPSLLAILCLLTGLSLCGVVMTWPGASRRQLATRIRHSTGGRKKDGPEGGPAGGSATLAPAGRDRKSTRLNSSH